VAIQSFRDLEVWQCAMRLVESVYAITSKFPSSELYGLTSQMWRCAVSIPSNIAEGRGRKGTREFVNFLSIAYGSLCELQTQLELAQRLRFVEKEVHERIQTQTDEVGRMLNGLTNSLNRRNSNP
jgi:four helix bundle protein